MIITYDPFDLTVQGPGPPQTSDMGSPSASPGPPQKSVMEPQASLTSVMWIQIIADMSKLVHLRTPTGADIWWPLKHVQLASR